MGQAKTGRTKAESLMALELAVDSLKENKFRCYWKLAAEVNLCSGR